METLLKKLNNELKIYTEYKDGIILFDDRIFDSIYSIFLYLGKEEQYDYFLGANAIHRRGIAKELEQYKKYETILMEVDSLFYSLPNLKPTLKEKDIYYFSKDTSFVYQGKKYNVKKYARVFILKNFANQKVGIEIQRAYKDSRIIKIDYGLIHKPFYEYKSNEKKEVIISFKDENYSAYLKSFVKIFFDKTNYYALLGFFKRNKDTLFNIKTSYPETPKAKFLFKHPAMKALLYKDFPYYKTTIYNVIKNTFYTKAELKDMLSFLNSIDIYENIHPQYAKDFLSLKKELKDRLIPKKQKEREIRNQDLSRVTYFMQTLFEEHTIKGDYALKCTITDEVFIFDRDIQLKDASIIKKHLERHEVIEFLNELPFFSKKRHLNTKLIKEYLKRQYAIHNKVIVTKIDKQWTIMASNGKIMVEKPFRKIHYNFHIKTNNKLTLRVLPIKSFKKGDISWYRAGIRCFIAKQKNNYDIKLATLIAIVRYFPLFYLLKVKMPIRMFFEYDVPKEYFLKLLKNNLYFKVTDEEILNIIQLNSSEFKPDIYIGVNDDYFKEKLHILKDKRFISAMHTVQKNDMEHMLYIAENPEDLTRLIRNRKKKLKRMAKRIRNIGM